MERHQFDHPEAGTVYVSRYDETCPKFPRFLPYFCCGYYYETLEAAYAGFCERWERSKTEEPQNINTHNFDHDHMLEWRYD